MSEGLFDFLELFLAHCRLTFCNQRTEILPVHADCSASLAGEKSFKQILVDWWLVSSCWPQTTSLQLITKHLTSACQFTIRQVTCQRELTTYWQLANHQPASQLNAWQPTCSLKQQTCQLAHEQTSCPWSKEKSIFQLRLSHRPFSWPPLTDDQAAKYQLTTANHLFDYFNHASFSTWQPAGAGLPILQRRLYPSDQPVCIQRCTARYRVQVVGGVTRPDRLTGVSATTERKAWGQPSSSSSKLTIMLTPPTSLYPCSDVIYWGEGGGG